MARIAVVRNEDNICVNVIIAEVTDLAPIDSFLIDVDNMMCDIGWRYDPIVNDFIDPNAGYPEEVVS